MMGHQHSSEFKDRFLYEATLVKIVDGDTIDVKVDLGFKIFHEIRLRLQGSGVSREFGWSEEVAGKTSKEALEYLLGCQNPNPEKRVLFIETEKTGKYGRYIATVWMSAKWISEDMLDGAYTESFNDQEWLNVNEYMVFHKFAKRYE